jgi:hypothetical protein
MAYGHTGNYSRFEPLTVTRIIPRIARPAKVAVGGFFEQTGRKPIPGIDYDADAELCQDDFEYLTSTGRYTPPNTYAATLPEFQAHDCTGKSEACDTCPMGGCVIHRMPFNADNPDYFEI